LRPKSTASASEKIASDLGRLERRMRDLIDVRVTPDRQAHLAPKQR
jgi:hypothetical protein